MLLTAIAALALGASLSADQPPPAMREFRGVWVATVDHIDWPPRNVFDTEKQKERLTAILDEAQHLHLNAVILQVRPMGDALYKSDLEPWSEFLTGEQGKPPSPFWDPLAFAVFEAHLRGLELHAWFNPYRVWHPAAKGKPAANYLGYQHPSWVKTYGDLKWLDPGEPGVREWSEAVIMDVVKRYDIDGVHLDDYFYPYPIRDSHKNEVPFPDDASYAAYRQAGGTLSRDDWRRKNVDDFIANLYRGIKSAKPWVKFGISPFGIYRPGYPAGIQAGIDQYSTLYSDPLKWLQQGWCDYLSPQLYWPIKQKAQSYSALAKWWSEENTLNRHLWFGNYLSRVSRAWPPSEIVDQIKVTRDLPNTGGNIFFSMTPLMKDAQSIDQVLLEGPYSEPALIPASPWLHSRTPKEPRVSLKGTGEGLELTLRREDSAAYQWVLYLKRSGRWSFDRLLSAQQSGILLNSSTLGQGVDEVAVSALDRYGNESKRVVIAAKA